MKKADIEKKLRESSYGFAPDVLQNVMRRKDEPIYEKYPFSIKRKRDRRRSGMKKFVTAFACALAVVIGIGMYLGIMNQDYETVYLEINPSLEITLNRFKKVKKVSYLNEEAEELFAGYNMKGKKIDEVAENFVDFSYENGYMNQDENNFYVFVDAKNEKVGDATVERLKHKMNVAAIENNVPYDIMGDRVTKEQKEKARKEKIPVGKMILIDKIIESDSSYEREDIKNENMRELHDILKVHGENRIDEEDRQQANNENIPVAKLVLMEQIIELDSSYTIDELREESVSELRKLVRNLRKEEKENRMEEKEDLIEDIMEFNNSYTEEELKEKNIGQLRAIFNSLHNGNGQADTDDEAEDENQNSDIKEDNNNALKEALIERIMELTEQYTEEELEEKKISELQSIARDLNSTNNNVNRK